MTLPLAYYYVRKTALWLGAAAILGTAVGRLAAGDAIVFGSGNTKAEPGKEKPAVKNSLRLEKLTAPTPFDLDGVTPPILPRISVDPKKDKRQQNAEDERKNWLTFEKDDLQSQDDDKNFLGIKDEELEDLDNTKNSHDYTFRDNKSSRTPAHLRAPGQSQARLPGQRNRAEANQPAPSRDQDESPETKKAPRSSAIVFGPDNPAGTGKQFDLKGLLDTKGEREHSVDKSDFSLRDFIAPSDSIRTRDQKARDDSFRQLLDRRPPGNMDALGSRSDMGSSSINPMAPYSFTSPAFKSPADDNFTSKSSLGQPNNSANFLSSPDAASRSSMSPAQPASTWKVTPVEWPKSRF